MVKTNDFQNASFDAAVFVSLSSYRCYCFKELTKLLYDRLRPRNDTQKCGLVSF